MVEQRKQKSNDKLPTGFNSSSDTFHYTYADNVKRLLRLRVWVVIRFIQLYTYTNPLPFEKKVRDSTPKSSLYYTYLGPAPKGMKAKADRPSDRSGVNLSGS